MKQRIPKQPILFGIYASRPHVRWVIMAITAVIGATVIDRFNVVVLRNLADAIGKQPINFNTVWFWTILFPILYLLAHIFWRTSGFTGMRWFVGLRSTIYQNLYDYLSHHSKDYFNSRFAGALTNKMSNAADGTEELFEKFLWQFLQLFIILIVYAIVSYLANWVLGTIILLWSVLFLCINVLFSRKLQPYSYRSAEALSTLKGRIVDSLSNISLVQEHAYVTGERKYIKGFVKKQYDKSLRSWWISEWVLVINGFLIFLFMFLMISSAIYLLQTRLISIGVVVMVIAIIGDLTGQLFFIGQEMRDSARLYGQIKEGLDEILHKHAIADLSDASTLVVERGNIELKQITFNFENTKVFSDFSLTIPAGQKVGLVGRSGAGKSTFVALLLRHFDVEAGAIEIDNQDIHTVTLQSLRQNISFVPQDTSLFHRTIKENILYGNPDATEDQVKNAAKQAQADGFIEKLPHGYDTLVGERGVKLSGGQRQRISIARAFLKNAPILILDEATSSLDSESEQAIQESLEELMKQRTVIAIAHRLSTLKKMDRIVLIDNGQIVEDGNPEELLKRPDGLFKSMWEHQVKGFIIDE